MGAVKVRVVGYLRVSSDGQEHGYGLDVQRNEIESYAEREGLELDKVFVDVGVPGSTPLGSRRELSKALRWVEQGKASALLVPRQDRLARDLLEALLIERTFREVGGGVLYASGLNGDSHTIEFARSMMHAVAQFEKRQMVSRLAEARKASGHLGGRPPFGYESKKGVLFVKEPEGEVIRWIFGKVANERRSVRQLAKMLDVEGTLDRRWSASDVHRIVKRREYKCGPPESRIVDARVWSKAQAALARRRKSFA